MQKLRNLPLAVSLGAAFGALALGLLIVSAVAFRSTDGLDTKIRSLAKSAAYTALVDGIAARVPDEGERVAQHCTSTTAISPSRTRSPGRSPACGGEHEGVRRHARRPRRRQDAETRAAAEGVRKLRAGYEQFAASSRKALELSREETVTADAERAGSRELYTQQLIPMAKKLDSGRRVASAKGTGVRRRRGPEGRRPASRPSARSSSSGS